MRFAVMLNPTKRSHRTHIGHPWTRLQCCFLMRSLFKRLFKEAQYVGLHAKACVEMPASCLVILVILLRFLP